MPPATRPKTVLIVDDDRDVRLFLASIMTHTGYRTLIADSLTEGLCKAEDAQPDCIILNCLMCGEDGMRLYQALRTHEELKRTPVVMVSAIDKGILRQHWMFRKAEHAGAFVEPDAFLASPPEADAVVSAVEKLTAKPKSEEGDGGTS